MELEIGNKVITLTTPEVLKAAIEDEVIDCIEKIEAELQHKGSREQLFKTSSTIIEGEWSRQVLDKVQDLYKQAGWSECILKTSSENGERPGLTLLTFATK